MSGTTNPTLALARYAVSVRAGDLPLAVEQMALRTFLNYLGCALGGARHESVETAVRALGQYSGPPAATAIGRGERYDILLASLVNSMSASVYSFDDTHAEAVVHPGGPVASALLALAETRPVSGAEFLLAFTLGAEVVCRVSKAISVAPARGVMGWVQTGIAAGIGAAVGVGKLLALDEQRLAWAIGIAACQAGGMRSLAHSMCFSFMAGQAAQSGLRAALLAEQGFTSSENALTSANGYTELYAEAANPAALTAGLGEHFEILSNTFKPYPCGVVIHPVIDACLEVGMKHAFDLRAIERIRIEVNSATLKLSDRQHPQDSFAGQASAQHWAAAALVDRAAGIAQSAPAKLRQPEIVALRDKIELAGDAALARDAAAVRITLASGEVLVQRVAHCRGAAERPMTDAELEQKFRDQAATALPAAEVEALVEACRTLSSQCDVGNIARRAAGRDLGNTAGA